MLSDWVKLSRNGRDTGEAYLEMTFYAAVSPTTYALGVTLNRFAGPTNWQKTVQVVAERPLVASAADAAEDPVSGKITSCCTTAPSSSWSGSSEAYSQRSTSCTQSTTAQARVWPAASTARETAPYTQAASDPGSRRGACWPSTAWRGHDIAARDEASAQRASSYSADSVSPAALSGRLSHRTARARASSTGVVGRRSTSSALYPAASPRPTAAGDGLRCTARPGASGRQDPIQQGCAGSRGRPVRG